MTSSSRVIQALRNHATLTSEEAYRNGKQSKPALLSLGLLTFITFVGNFTQLQLTSALPTIVQEFNIDLTTGQWLTSIFQLIMGIMVPLTAFLTQRFSTRQIVIASMGLFTIGSVLAWLGPTFPLVLIGRALEAIGTGVMWPVLQIVVFMIFPVTHRGAAMGTVGVAMAVSPAIGPTLGGWQTDTNGWRSIFLSLAVIGALACVAAAVGLRNFIEKDSTVHADFFSVALSCFGFGGLLFGFTNIESNSITSPMVIVPGIIGIAGIIWFILRQLHHTKPLLNLRVLKNRYFATGTIVASLSFFAFSSIMVLLPLYIQNDRGYSATMSGIVLLPGAIAQAISQFFGGRALDRFGARPIAMIGSITLFIGTVGMGFISMTTPIWWVSLCQFIRQIGMGFVLMPITTWSLNNLPAEQVSDGSAVTNTARQIAGAVGAPVLVVTMESLTALRKGWGFDQISANIWAIDWTLRLSALISGIMVLVVIFGVKGTAAGSASTTLHDIREHRRARQAARKSLAAQKAND
ncbi:MAG: multidrug efflux MFS transporter [Bifidobacteriaceae bacterium]|nr:multidrug efflux MFS transporter [Bifidobacteriaceae bacterium]